jgi:hypothetical protein
MAIADIVVVAVVTPMTTVAAMHEQMHQRTGEYQQIGQSTVQMRSVLGQQEKGNDAQRGSYAKTVTQPPVISAVVVVLRVIVLHGTS